MNITERDQKISQILKTSIQSTDDFNVKLEELNDTELLTDIQKVLLKEIIDKFDPDESPADKYILYETTGYHGEDDYL